MSTFPPFASYITFEEFSGERCTLEEFRSWIKRFSRNNVMHALSLVNAFLETWQGTINLSAHENLIRDAFFPQDANHLLEISRLSAHPRFVFHRLQLLFVAKEAILFCSDDGLKPLQTPHWAGLGLGLLMANDLLHKELEAREGSVEKTLERISMWIPMIEYSGRYTLFTKLGRAKFMITKSESVDPPKYFKNIKELICEATGISLETYMSVCIGILSHYLSIDYSQLRQQKVSFLMNRKFLESINVDQKQCEIVLNELSTNGDSLKNNMEKRNGGPTDFTFFRDTPLYRLDTETFFPIDTRFLAEKLGAGLFWRIHNVLDTNQKKEAFHQFWGDAFEVYVNWLFKNSVSEQITSFYPSPKFTRSGAEVCDGIIVCGSEAMFLEYKGHTFTAKAKYSGDIRVLDAEIKKHLIGSADKPKGIQQLTRSIEKVFKKKNPELVETVDLAGIRTIYPVLITRDEIGDCTFINPYLNKKAMEFFNRKLVRPKIVTPVFCMSIDALETISAYLSEVRLTKILESWYQQDRSLRFPFLSLFSKNPLRKSIGERQNEKLNKLYDDVWEDAKNRLFPNHQEETH